jgi:hypothetical protein
MGRFTSKDAWQGDYTRPQSLNQWSYGYHNPVKYTDPSGLQPPGHDPEFTIGRLDYETDTQATIFRKRPQGFSDSDGANAVALPLIQTCAHSPKLCAIILALEVGVLCKSGFEWVEANTPFREWVGQRPNATTRVFHEKYFTGIRLTDEFGRKITHLTIENQSFETIEGTNVEIAYFENRNNGDPRLLGIFSQSILQPILPETIKSIEFVGFTVLKRPISTFARITIKMHTSNYEGTTTHEIIP